MIRQWTVPLVFALALCHGARALGQTETVETDPIRCWWRTSASAVRVGEPFSVVLTCSVVETESVTVVPNQAELEPDAIQLPPFDVIGGFHGTDLRSADHRFFQYEYRLRIVREDVFDKEAYIPELRVGYRLRSRVDAEFVEGRDQTYALPTTSVRVLSLVPSSATDIRDTSIETFETIDTRLSRANLLRVTGGVLMGLAVLAALVAAVRLAGRARGKTLAPRSLVSDGAILRGVGHEIASIRRARLDGGWKPDLVGRLLTALRIISGYALGLPATAATAGMSAGNEGTNVAGQVTLRGRGLRGGRVTIPGWVTSNLIAQKLGRGSMTSGLRPPRLRNAEVLESLEAAMALLTSTHYGRESSASSAGPVDEVAVDEALALASSALRRLRFEHAWPVKQLKALWHPKAGLGKRAWSR